MGVWRFVREAFLDNTVPNAAGRVPGYIGREASASPAQGSYKAHLAEQQALLRKIVSG
jgi:2-oxoglutarate dehydrogenase complex dehydrogenase (E1) component-like enzyme